MLKFTLISGGFLCLTAVAAGAFGAHLLADLLQQNGRVATFELANRYQFYHGLALMIIAVMNSAVGLKIKAVPVLMLVGVCVFSGSLYCLALSNQTWLGAVTPIGGLMLIMAWMGLLVEVWREQSS